MRLAVDQEIPYANEAFSRFGEVTLFEGRTLESRQIKQTDVLLVRSVTPVNAALLGGTDVKWVGTATAGTDHIDHVYLAEQGIGFFDAAGCNARAVAEFIVACTLECCAELLDDDVELSAGVIGYGHVGRDVAELLTALGITCLLNDPPLAAAGTGIADFVSLQKALDADIVTVHAPLTTTGDYPTVNLIGAEEIAALKTGAVFINAARGGIVDETVLMKRLNSGAGLRVGIDCWMNEPSVSLDLAEQAQFATPHLAGHTIDARVRATSMLVAALESRIATTEPWTPPEPEPANPIHVTDAHGACQQVREIVRRCVDVSMLTNEFLRGLSGSGTQRRAEFDALRRRALKRREFRCHSVASEGLSPDTVTMCQVLGFNLIDGASA